MHHKLNRTSSQLMKSQFQTLSFLSQFAPSSDLDRDVIIAFLEKRYRITPKTAIFALSEPFELIDTQSFLQWYESGYSATQIAKYANHLVILGQCDLKCATIIGEMIGDFIKPCSQRVSVSNLTPANESETRQFQIAMLSANLQFNAETMQLESKFIPNPGDKIIFHNHDHSEKGLAIVRNVIPGTDEIELFCYFVYPSKTAPSRLGYSMHENNIVNLTEYTFEPLLDNDKRFSQDDGISAYRRLKRELEKENKIWKDKLSRVEPSHMKRNVGEKYWYISDKMEVRQETEKGTPTSNFRYLSGNYFVTFESAVTMIGKWNEMLRDYLASPNWPTLDD